MAIKIGRTRLPPEAIEKVNHEPQRQMAEATKLLNDALDSAGAELEQNGITKIASYETVPMQDNVAVTSPLANRMVDLLLKLDQYMPLLSTLEILEVIPESEADTRRARAKRAVLGLSSSALRLWFGVQRRMQEADRTAARAAAAEAQAAQLPLTLASQDASPPGAAFAPKGPPRRKRPARLPMGAGGTDAVPAAAPPPPELPVTDTAVGEDFAASTEEVAQPA